MSVETLQFTGRATKILIRHHLRKRFADTAFCIAEVEPFQTYPLLQLHAGFAITWVDGPSREDVETALSRFQSLDWDPRSGHLELREHYEVSRDGELQRIEYGVDYVFCEGPVQPPPD